MKIKPYPRRRQTIVFDADGTLFEYDHWRGEEHVGRPISGAVEFARLCDFCGFDVVVSTARSGAGLETIRTAVLDAGIPAKTVTNEKPIGVLYIGKWMIRFCGDWEAIGGPPMSENEEARRDSAMKELPDIPPEEWGYIGGLIDGEGCFTGKVNGKGKDYMTITVANQHREVLEKTFQERFGGSLNKGCNTRDDQIPVYYWVKSGIGMAPMLMYLLDHNLIKMKRNQAELALEYFMLNRYNGRAKPEFNQVRQEQITEAIKALNKHGCYMCFPITIDDRGYRFCGDWQKASEEIAALLLEPGIAI